MVDIEFVVDTGTDVSLNCKVGWTQVVKRDNALFLEQYSGKKLVGAVVSHCRYVGAEMCRF